MAFMVTKLDDCKLPRAWGKAPTEDQARREANKQLSAYVTKKRALGESITVFDFTESVQEVE